MGVFKLKNILKIVFVIIGCIIGAGFASGQEILLFFNSYGEKGLWGIALQSIIILAVIYKVFKITTQKNIHTYEEFINATIKINSKRVKNIVISIINLFLLISFYIMIAGSFAFFKQEYSIQNIIFHIFIIGICYIVFTGNLNGIIKLNTICIPILIALILGLFIKNIDTINKFESLQLSETTLLHNWLMSSLLYASYNSIMLIPVLIPLSKLVQKKSDISKVSYISGIIIFCLALVIYRLLYTVMGDTKMEIPLIHIAGKFGTTYKYLYGLVIIAAIFTSAISSGYAFLTNVTKSNAGYKIVAAIMCICALFFARIGFSNLVNLLYPIFGYIGLIQLFTLLKVDINQQLW
jgi:uncharacterized membrane protein YkvI